MMKYLKYFENIEITQQPFYLSPGDFLYLSEDIAKSLRPSLKEIRKIYNPGWANKELQDHDDFFNDVRKEDGYLKKTNINIIRSVTYDRNLKMNLHLSRFSPERNNEFGTFKTKLSGQSGDYSMHGKNMKRATRECNLNFIITLYPIVAYIKNFYKIFKSGDKSFFDIIKEALDKDIMLAQYGIPKEIKYLFDNDIEGSIIQQIKFNT